MLWKERKRSRLKTKKQMQLMLMYINKQLLWKFISLQLSLNKRLVSIVVKLEVATKTTKELNSQASLITKLLDV